MKAKPALPERVRSMEGLGASDGIGVSLKSLAAQEAHDGSETNLGETKEASNNFRHEAWGFATRGEGEGYTQGQ